VLAIDAAPSPLRISLRDEVVEPGSQVPIVFVFKKPLGGLKCEIVVQRIADSSGAAVDPPAEDSRLPLQYLAKSAPLDSLAFELTAPQYAGIYTVDVHENGQSIAERPEHLIVQQ
jgi:hypothetical protein